MKARAGFPKWDRGRLRRLLALFFLALAVPTGILVRQAYRQLKWESFHQHRVLAEELAARIDARLVRLIEAEEARSYSDYAFLVVAGGPAANFVQRSPLSEYPVKSGIPGLLGWFQVDANGVFSTPLLPPSSAEPSAYGISGPELERRTALQNRVLDILGSNRLVEGRSEEKAARLAEADQEARRKTRPDTEGSLRQSTQAAFDALGKAESGAKGKQAEVSLLERVEDLKLDSRYPAESAPSASSYRSTPPSQQKRAARKEQSLLPEPEAPAADQARPAPTAPSRLRVTTFESEIDPFEFNRLASGHFVLFRKVWRDGQRTIQGALVEPEPFLRGVFEAEFARTALSRISRLLVAHRGEMLAAYGGNAAQDYQPGAPQFRGSLLYHTRCSTPFSEVELIFTIDSLPAGPGGVVVAWLAGILAVVLCGGFALMYRLGLRQIALARQQQEFVSAVSHELKTPLTSIRMYGEMLREGWVAEERKKTYYDFIYHESERLSRLIANVLQLSRMTRNGLSLELKPVGVAELLDGVRSRISSQVERAGFESRLHLEAEDAVIRVDADAFAQIAINLVDNALKFSAKSPHKAIDIGFRRLRDGTVVFSVRDYGPGIPRDRMKQIFRLFYRLENELTRETVGTGIGLALVRQLATAMDAAVDVVNRDPGAEFRVLFRALPSSDLAQ